MATLASSKKNKQASAEHTRATGRNKRVTAEVLAGQNNSGDFKNSTEMKKYNGALGQQNFSTHQGRYADLVAAFGRGRKGDPEGDPEGVGGGKAALSFSAG